MIECFPRCIDRHLVTIRTAEPSEIVEPENMISVRMGIDDRVHPRDVCSQGLQPEFDGGVNYPTGGRCLDIDGGPPALVPTIRGPAHRTVAEWNRYAYGGSCTQKSGRQHLLKKGRRTLT